MWEPYRPLGVELRQKVCKGTLCDRDVLVCLMGNAVLDVNPRGLECRRGSRTSHQDMKDIPVDSPTRIAERSAAEWPQCPRLVLNPLREVPARLALIVCVCAQCCLSVWPLVCLLTSDRCLSMTRTDEFCGNSCWCHGPAIELPESFICVSTPHSVCFCTELWHVLVALPRI